VIAVERIRHFSADNPAAIPPEVTAAQGNHVEPTPDRVEPRVSRLVQTRALTTEEYAGLTSPLDMHELALGYPLLPDTARPDRPHETSLKSLGDSMLARGLDHPITLYRRSTSHLYQVLEGPPVMALHLAAELAAELPVEALLDAARNISRSPPCPTAGRRTSRSSRSPSLRQ
jgi:hypothetical protein